jgi:hypothetical protein
MSGTAELQGAELMRMLIPSKQNWCQI